MHTSLTSTEAANLLMNIGHFSFDASRVLVSYLDEIEEESGEDFELDPIAIRCQFNELSEEDIEHDYGYLLDGPHTFSELLMHINERTLVLPVTERIFLIEEF